MKAIVKDNTPKLVAYLRKSNGHSTESFAKLIGLSRSSLSRVESGERSLKLEEYAQICEFAKIDYDSISDSSIDINNTNDLDNFDIPKKWREHQYSHHKTIDLYSKYFESIIGKEDLEAFCLSEGIDPLYFYNKRNSINISFMQAMIKAMMLKGHLRSDDSVNGFAYLASKDLSEGINSNKEISTVQKIVELPGVLEVFEKNHQYRIENMSNKDSTVELSFRPLEHVDTNIWREDYLIGGFVENLICKSLPMVAGTDFYKTNILRRFKKKKSKWTTMKIRLHCPC